MDLIPIEIIEYIYSFLPLSNTLRATEVCLRWKAIFETQVAKKLLLKIDQQIVTSKEESCYAIVQCIAKTNREYQHVVIENMDFIELNRQTTIQMIIFLANIGLYVKDFTLKKCRLTVNKLYQITSMLKQAQTINFERCNIDCDSRLIPGIRPKLNKLETIGFHNMMDESEMVVIDLLSDGNQANIELSINDDYLENKIKIINKYASRIRYLSCKFLQSNTIRTIFDYTDLKLHTLQLQRAPLNQLHFNTLSEQILQQKNLRELRIDIPISAAMLVDISKSLVCLEFLSIVVNTSESRTDIVNWPNLKVLHLSHRDNINVIFAGMFFAKLAELEFHTERLSKSLLKNVYEKCKNLKRIRLSTLSMVRCDTILGSIGLHLLKLEAIDIQCSSSTTFIPLFNSIESLEQLTSITIFFCEKITDQTVKHMNIPFLNLFSITGNRKISQKGLETLCVNCPRITSLTIQDCCRIDDAAIETVATHLHQLEYLNINESSGITMNSIRYIMENLLNLKVLRIDNCQRILTLWRSAPHYIHNIYSLRKYYETYPEFFYYDLPNEVIQDNDSDNCYFNDYVSDTDSEDEIFEEYVADMEEVGHNAEIIILSDDD